MGKQTTVEWLYNHLFPNLLDGFSDEEWDKIDNAFEQAKQMEKQQMLEFAEWFKESDWDWFDNTSKGNIYANHMLADELLTINEIYEQYYKDKK